MFSIVIPLHNEEATLQSNLKSVTGFLKDRDYEIILAEDGSTDNTLQIAKKLQSKKIRVITSKKRLGRGLALTNAIKQAKGERIIYMDADLATDLSHIDDLLKVDADVVTGSRLLPESQVERNFLRDFFSKGYNLLIRILFNSKIHDHQCGFKCFKKSIIPILDEVKDHHWFWDTELLIRAEKLTVKEIPVKWTDKGNSKVNLYKDILYMGLAALRLRLTI